MSTALYITGGFEPAAHPPGLGNPFITSRSSAPPFSYITGSNLAGSDSDPRETRDHPQSIRTRSPKPYRPSPTSSRTLTPGMATPAEASTSPAPMNTNGEASTQDRAPDGLTTPMQELVQAMALSPSSPAPPSARSTSSDAAQSRPSTTESSTSGHSSLVSATTSSINTTPGQIRLRPPRPDAGQPLWTHRLSASFNAMAAQVEAASQAIALIPPLPAIEADVVARVSALEAAQANIEEAMNDLRSLIERIGTKDGDVQEVSTEAESSATPEPKEEIDVAALKKLVEDLDAKQKLDQQRLPARLHNSIVTVSKGLIKPVVFANGKQPPQFPVTRGEFFHLTKERYEALMKGYGIPISGDLNAKRNAVREFVGLPE